MNGDGMQQFIGLLFAYLLVAETSYAKEMEMMAHFKPPFASLAAQDPLDSRIYNGVTATSPLPFIVSLQARFQSSGWVHFCGGSLISPTKILTAAHCLHGLKLPQYNGFEYRAALGSTQHLYPETSAEFELKDMEIDDRYRNQTSLYNAFPYDFAVIHLRRPVRLSSNVQTISPARKEYYGAITIAGWGKYDCVHTSLHLFFIRGNTVPKHDCEAIWSSQSKTNTGGNHVTFGDEKICAIALSPIDGSSANPDQGDSGGPLYFQDNGGKAILLGIVSFGALQAKPSTCFRSDVPFVFSKVSANLGFIEASAVLSASIICKVLTSFVCAYALSLSL